MDISKLKFYYMEGDGGNVSDPIGPDVRNAMEKARNHIKNTYNIDVKPVRIFLFEHINYLDVISDSPTSKVIIICHYIRSYDFYLTICP